MFSDLIALYDAQCGSSDSIHYDYTDYTEHGDTSNPDE